MKAAILINTALCLLSFWYSIRAIMASYVIQKELEVKSIEELHDAMKRHPISAQYFIANDKLAFIRTGRFGMYLMMVASFFLMYWSVQRIDTGWQAYAATQPYIAIAFHFCIFLACYVFALLAKGKSLKIFQKIKI